MHTHTSAKGSAQVHKPVWLVSIMVLNEVRKNSLPYESGRTLGKYLLHFDFSCNIILL